MADKTKTEKKTNDVTIVASCGKEKVVSVKVLSNYIGKGWEKK